jgi:glycosyltransferase involved in cell wall biosynthesis
VPPPTRTRRLVLTIHDLAFRLHPDTAPLATRRWLERLDRALRQAARIIVPSHATRSDLLEHYPVDPETVRVIHHGVNAERLRRPPEGIIEQTRRRHGIVGPYLLFLGGIEPRKNLPAIVRAFAQLPDDARLVIAGGSVAWNPEGRERLDRALEDLSPATRGRITLTGYLREPEKVALLAGAEALVFTSLYEGFGFPLLEAMAAGTPVLTSDLSSLPEVAGDAALLVDPGSWEAIAEGMERAAETNDDITFMRLDREFNLLELEGAQNEFAAGAMTLMHGLSRRFWYIHYKQVADMPLAARLHAAVARAVAAGEPNAAAAASDRLIDYIQDFSRKSVG